MKLRSRFVQLQEPTVAEPLELNLDAIGRSRDLLAVEGVEPRRPLEADLVSKIITVDPDGERPTREEQDRSSEAAHDLRVLHEGAWHLGYHDPRLREFEGGPGLDELLRAIAKCNEIIGHERKMRSIRWPAPHRYIGHAGAARVDGVVVRRGETVLLTRNQHELWSDRFAIVNEDEETITTS
jgi:hypothetical protein